MRRIIMSASLLGMLAPLATSASAATTVSVIYPFKANLDGASPNADLTFDSAGNLYTTTANGGGNGTGTKAAFGVGTIARLTPPAPGQTKWTSTTLYRFKDGTDGAVPYGPVTFDKAGVIYTTTSGGGTVDGNGTIIKLVPPAPGRAAWLETVLYSFQGGTDGANPYGGVIADAAGNLYTTTYVGGANGLGTIIQLTPSASGKSWTETVLYSFAGGKDGALPITGLTADGAGNLYTTTTSGGLGFGTVVKLTPPAPGKTQWTESVLYAFKGGADGAKPTARLTADASGNFYTTTVGGGSKGNFGTVVKLSPPAPGHTAWTESVLYAFKGKPTDGANPRGSVLIDRAGALYVTTSRGGIGGPTGNYGTIVKLTPPAAGATAWTETVLWNFTDTGVSAPPLAPVAGLIADSSGTLYTTTLQGGSWRKGSVISVTGTGYVPTP